MNSFNIVNLLAMIFGLVFIFNAAAYNFGRKDFYFCIYIFAVGFMLSFFANVAILINIILMLLSLNFMFHKNFFKQLKGAGQYEYSLFLITVLALLIIIPVALKGADGWLIVFGVALKYWFLFLAVMVFTCSLKGKFGVWIIVAVLASGFLWQFKLSFFVFIVMFVAYLFSARNLRNIFYLMIGIALLIVYSILFNYDQISVFLEYSVIRPENDHDTKIFGLSDGVRLYIWSHYLENAIWLGKGDYHLPDLIPTHNIFVHLAHELGFAGLILFGPIIIYLLLQLSKSVGLVFSILVFLMLTLSSVSEYPAMWVPCLVLVPKILRYRVFARKIYYPHIFKKLR